MPDGMGGPKQENLIAFKYPFKWKRGGGAVELGASLMKFV
jgi:hypothetical protein